MAQSCVDGMGFEEVNQTVTSTAVVSGTNVYATTAVTTPTVVATTVSGATLRSSEGIVKSVITGSPAVYGAFVQTGSFVTDAGSAGTIEFGAPFASKDYFVLVSPLTLDVDGAGSVVPTASGTKNVSGCEAVGAASSTYAYCAVGV